MKAARIDFPWLRLLPAVPKLVLVVDDDDGSRDACVATLEEFGFRVCQASNGARACAEAFQRQPDLILMDLGMPVMGGVEAILRLKADRRTRSVPIVVLSAADTFLHAKAMMAGASGCLSKPCVPKDLESVVRSLTVELGDHASRQRD